jgi:hypothetical protein
MPESLAEKHARFERALSLFVDRLKQDRYVLGAVLLGSLSTEIIWRRETLSLWLIEADGVTCRRRADGEEKRIFRHFVEEGVTIEAELIPRSRFKQMVEGNSRTAFTCNFFAQRILLYATDDSIGRWFESANTIATKDQDTALMVAATWLIHPQKYLANLYTYMQDWELARQEFLWVSYSLAAIEIIRHGEVFEGEMLYRGRALNPTLFAVVYDALRDGPATESAVQAADSAVKAYLAEHQEQFLKPVLTYLRKKRRMMPLSEIADDFGHTQLYPWHIETACEWLSEQGVLRRFSAPHLLTQKSRVELEEPAYELISDEPLAF